MWSYYGGKANLAHLYPPPKYGKIIEPFAGSAQYALRYFDRDVLLVDKYEVIVKLWKWLQNCSKQDILKLPRLKPGQKVENFTFDCDEAKWLLGYSIGFGNADPRKTASPKTLSRPNFVNFSLKRIASDLFKIRHWKIIQGCYSEIPNEPATWFIDPPYQKGGENYICSNKNFDYLSLANWCKTRLGQKIVCEKSPAIWLDFHPFVKQRTKTGLQNELIWTNEANSYNVRQQKLFS